MECLGTPLEGGAAIIIVEVHLEVAVAPGMVAGSGIPRVRPNVSAVPKTNVEKQWSSTSVSVAGLYHAMATMMAFLAA